MSHPSNVWGVQRRLLALAPGLFERGVQLSLAAPEGGRWPEAWRATGLPFEPLRLPEHRGLRSAAGQARAGAGQLVREAGVVVASALRVARLARRYDVLFSGSLTAHTETAIAGRLAGKPTILMLVDIVAPGIGRRMLQAASALSWATVVNSSATASTLGDRGEVRLLHPGIDLGAYGPNRRDDAVRQSLGAGPGDVLVGIVGRIDEEKGVHHLIEALGELRRRELNFRLAIVGDVGTGPPGYAALVRERAEHALGDRVCLAGRRDDIPAVIASLDVLVNASRAEPFGMSVLEAHASGVAVVATASGGILDFVVPEESGLLVPPGDVHALRDALARAVTDADLRMRLARAGRRSAEDAFGLEAQFERYAELFREAAAHPARDRQK